MLKFFEVSGFKNFEKTFKIDFSDSRDYKFNTDCVKNGFIKTGIIYGKNSIGKTNFGLALYDIVAHLADKNVPPHIYDYYLNSNSTLANFHYVFDFDNNIIDYRYSKTDINNLVYEKILLNDELILEYDYSTHTGNFIGLKKLSPTINLEYVGDSSILRYSLNNTALNKTHPLYKFNKFISSMLWFRTLGENRYIGYKNKSDDYFSFIFDEKVVKEFETLLHSIGVSENLTVKTDIDGKKQLYFDTKTPLPFFKTCSSGTKALYTFFYWYKTASDSSFMYIDEFDAYYHYELSEIIVRLLEKLPNTQVILTTHNTNLLSNRIMRPDCYFVLTHTQLVSIANATDRELREGHNLEKLYMSGEFYEE